MLDGCLNQHLRQGFAVNIFVDHGAGWTVNRFEGYDIGVSRDAVAPLPVCAQAASNGWKSPCHHSK